MRTDVKVGLIFAFVVIVGIIGYFAWGTKKQDGASQVPPKASADLTTGNEPAGGAVALAPTLDTGLRITPSNVTATAPATAPATTSLTGGLTGTLPVTTAPGAGYPTGFGTTPPTLAASRPGDIPPEPRRAWDTTPTTHSAFDTGDTGFTWPAPTTHPAGETGISTDTLGGANPSTYTITKGDTFGILAKKFHVTVKAIEIANPGVNSSKLKINQKINIPAATSTAGTGASTSTLTPTTTPSGRHATTRPGRHGSSTTRPAPAATGPAGEPGGTYTVQSGDTLRAIAKRIYGDEKYWERIARVNRSKLPNPDALKVNMVLQLPPK